MALPTLPENLVRLGNIVIAIVALVVAVFAASFAHQSARAARLSARSAVKGAEANVAAVRAWVTVTDYEPPSQVSIRSEPMKVFYKNIGRTPAQKVYFTAESEFWSPSMPLPRLWCPTEKRQWGLTGTAGPDQTDRKGNYLPIWITAELKQDQVAKLVDHSAGVVIRGCIIYTTVFKDSMGATEFCSVLYHSQEGRTQPCADGSEFLR